MRRRSLLAAVLASPAAPRLARGQGAWPERPVRIIVPYPPGGSNDTVTRILQPRLGEILGRPIVVENRGGASGLIGAGEAVRAAPDGHTWILVNDTIAANDTLLRLPYKSGADFSACALVGTCPYALVTHRDTPWTALPAVIEASKARLQSLGYATTGGGSLAHISTVLLEQRGGFQLTHIPYRGGGPALQDALAAHVPLFMSNIVIILPHIRAGTLRPLGVTAARESRFLPGVKPFAELGFPGFEANTYWALLGPAGIPDSIVRRMRGAVAQVLEDAGVRARMEEQGAEIVGSTPEACAAFIRGESERWGQVIRENGISTDG